MTATWNTCRSLNLLSRASASIWLNIGERRNNWWRTPAEFGLRATCEFRYSCSLETAWILFHNQKSNRRIWPSWFSPRIVGLMQHVERERQSLTNLTTGHCHMRQCPSGNPNKCLWINLPSANHRNALNFASYVSRWLVVGGASPAGCICYSGINQSNKINQ